MRSPSFLAIALSAFIAWGAAYGQDAQALNIEFECPDIADASLLGADLEAISKSCKRSMWLSGEFVAGDYERVHIALRKRAEPVYKVNLFASPGGDLIEAMKIGDLIRRLRLSTFVAVRLPNGRALFDPFELNSSNQSMCASACVYAWLSGISRLGDWQLVIHRPYYDAAYFGSLSSEEADAKYAELESKAYDFLRKMDAPEQLIVMMRRVSSSDGEVLDTSYVSEELGGKSPSFDEWLTSKCGADIGGLRLATIMENAKRLGGVKNLPADQAKELEGFLCRGKEQKQAVSDAWENEFGK